MAILKYRSDSDREFLVALGTTIKPGADFLVGISLNFPDAFGIGVFAVRTYRAFRPKNRLNVFAGGFIAGKPGVYLVKRQVFWRWQHVRFHASNIA